MTSTVHVRSAEGVAPRLAEALRPFLGGELPVRLRAWDGSEAGPDVAPVVELRSPDAVRRLLWSPGELGAAQAYVSGELEVHHDLAAALDHVRSELSGRDLGRTWVAAGPGAITRALRVALGVGAAGRRHPPPATQARVRGLRHSRVRDSRAISFHYDLSNEFYALLLGEPMAYSCAYWTSDEPSYGLADAQHDKLDLVCRKLGLEPGMTLLDLGCGWGALSLHAARSFGARVTGVTIAAEQKRWIDRRIREEGLGDQVEIRLQDYRDVSGGFDAVGSLEMGEHVGAGNYPTYAETLARSVRPGGRVLVQQMSRPGRGGGRHPGGGPFIESFIAPDMHMRPVGETVTFLERAGLEVCDVHGLREHYARTAWAWLERFEQHRDALTALVGEEVVRVWRLYLVGGAMTFRDGRMGVDQILAVRTAGRDARTGRVQRRALPAVRSW